MRDRKLLPFAILSGSLAMVVLGGGLRCEGADESPTARALGMLGMLNEPSVLAELQVEAQAAARLQAMGKKRTSEALELAMQLRETPVEERAGKMAEFRAASEREALSLLTPGQQKAARGMWLMRNGLAMLSEAETAAAAEISEGQRIQIEQLVQQRDREVMQAGEKDESRVRADYERKMLEVLGRADRVRWDLLAAGQDPAQAEQILAAQDAQEARRAEPSAAAAAGAVAGGVPAEIVGPSDVVPPPPARQETGNLPVADSDTDSDADNALRVAQADADTPPEMTKLEDVRMKFNFRYTPWKDVLDWFAQQAQLSLVMDTPPAGTLSYTDSRFYSPDEAIDVVNRILLVKGFTLVRRDRMLMLINLEDEIPPDVVSQVLPEDLDNYGEFEIVNTLFSLNRMTAEDAKKEITDLLSKKGRVVVLANSRQIYVTDMAGRLRMVRRVLEAVENPPQSVGKPNIITLEHVSPEEFLVIARQLMGLDPNENSLEDGSLRIAIDPVMSRLLVTGNPDKIAQLHGLDDLVDIASEGELAGEDKPREFPQLEVYTVPNADPNTVLQVMQTLLAGLPDVRLTTDPKTGNLVALARPSEHATIRATIEQMQLGGKQIDVIPLGSVDPTLTVLMINKLFAGPKEGDPDPNAPKVDADLTNRKLLVRGTGPQIQQIREFVTKLGAKPDDDAMLSQNGGKVRFLTMSETGIQETLNKLNAVWPTMRGNRLRVVTPSTNIRPRTIERRSDSGTPEPPRRPSIAPPTPPDTSNDAAGNDAAGNGDDRQWSPETEQALSEFYGTPSPQPPVDAEAAAGPAERAEAQPQAPGGDLPVNDADLPEVVVAPGPGGIMIASDDEAALRDMENLLRQLSEQASGTSSREFTVYYLKYAKADTTAQLLSQILNGSSSSSTGGSTLGNLAGAALGGGDMLGALFGGGAAGATYEASGPVSIVPATRINALFVQASQQDLLLCDEVLSIIDRESSPEDVQTTPPPRLIPVVNLPASEVATTVREIYSQRIAGAQGQQNRQPSPEDFIRALRGGGRGGRGGDNNVQEELPPLSISVDAHSNSLVVSAPDPLFQEIQELVYLLDNANPPSNEASKVIQISGSGAAVTQAIKAMYGDKIQTSTGTSTTGSRNSSSSGTTGSTTNTSTSQANADAFRQRADFFNQMRQQGGFGGFGGRGGFSPFGGGNTGGFGGRGGFGGGG
ncbi:MAG: hypothetical protein KDA99_14145, partial [Planctomycetales bacterium]|nr:hypothetical protein [Planctomycetales bacterium]